MTGEGKPSSSELLFLHMVSMFQAAAMQQLGKIVDPLSGEAKRELDQARFSIDILQMLQEKTKGNLTKTEEEFLGKVLFELHMNYVDELKVAEKEKNQGQTATPAGENQETEERDDSGQGADDGNGQKKKGE